MSYDSILARSPSIIFQAGGVASELIVTTWAQVQKFIAARDSAVVVYVDDSIAPCNVPASTGVTDCQGRVEIRPRRQDGANFSTLTIDPGAQLKSLYKLSGTIFLQCNPTGAVPSLDFDYSVGAFGANAIPILFIEEDAIIGTAGTATTPACVVPANQELNVFLENFSKVFTQSTSALFDLSAGAIMVFFARASVFESATGAIPPTWVQGPGRFELSYDAGTAGYTNIATGGPVLAPGVAFTNAGSEVLGAIDGFPDAFNSEFFAIQDLYVNVNGSDTTGNGTQVWPFATIEKALSSISDASTSKRYVVNVAPGEYPTAFNFKPWVAIMGPQDGSGFQGTAEITAGANAIGFDPSFAGSGLSVFWASHLVFENQLTLDYSASPNQQIQGTFFDVNFNGGGGVGFQFIGAGTAGLDNWTLDNCLVYSGGLAQGVQFLFTIGGTQFLGGTVTIQAAPSAGALESTTWLAQNTAVGSAFSPTNVHVLWAAPTPLAFLSKLDWCNSNCVGQINLDGVSTSAAITGLRPANVIQSNGASPATVQPIAIEQRFMAVGTVTNVIGGFQTSGLLPTIGNLRVDIDGFGGTGGGGGGGAGGVPPGTGGTGGGGSGGAMYQTTSIVFDLSHRLDATVAAGGSPGSGGIAPAGAGGAGVDGFPSEAIDFTTSLILASLVGSSGGGGSGTGGHGGASYAGGVFIASSTDLAVPYGSGFPAAGGIGGGPAIGGSNGQNSYVQQGIPTGTGRYSGGLAGTSAPGEGGGGGGGGVGIFAPGSTGGNSNPTGTPGSPGGGTAPNSGSGAGGGAAGTGPIDNGGPGGSGSSGIIKLRFIVQ